MSFGFTGSPPPKKRPRPALFGDSNDDPDSDDSFNDPVLAEPSQITQAIMQRRDASQFVENARSVEDTSRPSSSSVFTSPLRPPINDAIRIRKPAARMVNAVTPRGFNAQERNDYHHNGQVLMLKNRVENLEREKERAAAATRDQIIAKEKEHATELSRRDERIRQLESQIISLVRYRHENLQTSFQLHNASLLGAVDVEMTDANNTLPPGPLLHTKK
ncbi:unnamed protein product, partial [Strongylus vulgaris]